MNFPKQGKLLTRWIPILGLIIGLLISPLWEATPVFSRGTGAVIRVARGYPTELLADNTSETVLEVDVEECRYGVAGLIIEPDGKCGETAPPPAGNAGGLTPQELANQGTHTYRIDCPNEEILGDDAAVLTFKFVDGGVEETYAGDTDFFQRIDVNTYAIFVPSGNTSWTYTYTFTNAGFTVFLSGGGERCEPGEGDEPPYCPYQGFHNFTALLMGEGGSATCTATRK